MKKQLTGHEKIAVANIKGAFDYEVGGWYNCWQDGMEDEIPDRETAMEAVYKAAMNDDYRLKGNVHFGHAPKEMRFAGEEFCRKCIAKLFAKDDDALELWGEMDTTTTKNKEEKDMKETKTTKKNAVTKEAKETKEKVEKAKKTTKAEEVTPKKSKKNSKKSNKVALFAFTGMYIGEFDIVDEGENIIIYTESKGELVFDGKTGKEITSKAKARYANRIERV